MNVLERLRRVLLPLFSVINPGDITIRHHYTRTPFRLHSFRHKGYWFYGKRRENETMRFFAEAVAAGDSVVEVGGHIGYVSVYLASLVGPGGTVWVLEPGENNLPYLERNTRTFPNVTVLAKGAADIDGELTLYTEDLTGQNNSFVKDYEVLAGNARSANAKPTITERSVPVVSLDTLVREQGLKPAFVKIDVEGFERRVLEGMHAILSGLKPGLMIEVTREADEVLSLLAAHGYRCYDRARAPITAAAGMRDNVFCLHPAVHGAMIGRWETGSERETEA